MLKFIESFIVLDLLRTSFLNPKTVIEGKTLHFNTFQPLPGRLIWRQGSEKSSEEALLWRTVIKTNKVGKMVRLQE